MTVFKLPTAMCDKKWCLISSKILSVENPNKQKFKIIIVQKKGTTKL